MWKRLKKYFISGLIVLVPMALTLYFLFMIITFADGLLGKYLEPYFDEKFGFYFRGLSIIISAYFVVLIGFFVTHFLGKKFFDSIEGLIIKLPFFRQVYPALKEMAIFLFSRDQLRSFKQVVLVEYPRKGIYSFAFLTNDTSSNICEKTKQELCNIFVPSAPGPLTGFVMMIPKKDIIFTDIRIEEAFKFIVSGGVVNPNISELIMAQIKLVIFDLDGTLIDAFAAVTQSINFMFKSIGYKRVDRYTVQRYVGYGETSLIRSFVKEEDLTKALKVYRAHHKVALKKGVKFLPWAKQALMDLRTKGYRLAVATNRPSRFSFLILRVLGIRRWFDYVICADQAGQKKPHPEMLKMVLKKTGFKPSEAMYVGDMIIDVQAGKRARMKTAAVPTGSCTYLELKAEKPDYLMKNMKDMRSIL